MKYVIDLKKDGLLRGRLVRATEEEARDIANEWSGRGCGNSADWQEKERLWYGIYLFGKLQMVADDATFDELNATGLFEKYSQDYVLITDGRFYESLSEAMAAQMREYGMERKL